MFDIPYLRGLLCIIVNHLNIPLFSSGYYITAFLGSLFFTIIVKQSVLYAVSDFIIFIGFESIVLLLVDIALTESILLVVPSSGVSDPDGVSLRLYNPNGPNQPFGSNLAAEFNRPKYRGKEFTF